MLDLNDFVTERGGDPKKIKESQRKRFAREEDVDDVIALYEDARKGKFQTTKSADIILMGCTLNSTVCSDSNWV